MSLEKMCEMANTSSVIVGLMISAFLVIRFYAPFVRRKYMAVVTGTAFFIIMSFLYLIPYLMSGVTAYIVGISVVCIVSLISDRRNIPQKIFLSLTII